MSLESHSGNNTGFKPTLKQTKSMDQLKLDCIMIKWYWFKIEKKKELTQTNGAIY